MSPLRKVHYLSKSHLVNINRVIETSLDILPSITNILKVTESFLKEKEKLKGLKFEEIKDIEVNPR